VAFEYENRCGDVYRLQAKIAKNGKPRYYFGRKLTGQPVDELPQGYEVFESPERGQVFLRRERPTEIEPAERQLLIDAIDCFSSAKHFIVRCEEDSLVVYLPTRSTNDVNVLVRVLAGPDALQVPRFREARDQLVREATYEKVMRFQLIQEEPRLFHVERWCSLDSIDGWIHLHGPARLSELADDYVEHLGEDSFYELF
jgi:hypothetical protein